MDQFGFSIDIKPDASMRIAASLGNVRALDCTVPEEHPYHQACGLRAGSNKSLVGRGRWRSTRAHAHAGGRRARALKAARNIALRRPACAFCHRCRSA